MTKRKRETWTFQPDDDVLALAKSLFGEKPPHGKRTEFVNEAIRLKYPDASLLAASVATAEREVSEAMARLARMRTMLAKIKRVSSSEKAGILSAADSKIQHGHATVHPNPPTTPPARKSRQG